MCCTVGLTRQQLHALQLQDVQYLRKCHCLQWPSIWFKFQDRTTVYPQADDSSHWFPFYTWQRSFQFCKICSNAFTLIATFLIRVYLLQGWMEVGCCFVVSPSLFIKPLNGSTIHHSALCSPGLLKLLISSSSAHPHKPQQPISSSVCPQPPQAHHPP